MSHETRTTYTCGRCGRTELGTPPAPGAGSYGKHAQRPRTWTGLASYQVGSAPVIDLCPPCQADLATFLGTAPPERVWAVQLAEIQQDSLANSKRWFPAVHESGKAFSHFALGLAGEAGEVANKVKKLTAYDDPGVSTADLAEELADVLTYLAAMAEHLGVDLVNEWAAKQAICEQRWGDPS